MSATTVSPAKGPRRNEFVTPRASLSRRCKARFAGNDSVLAKKRNDVTIDARGLICLYDRVRGVHILEQC